MTDRPRILIVTSNPSAITDDWVRQRFNREDAGEWVKVMTWEEIAKHKESHDVAIMDDLSWLKVHGIKREPVFMEQKHRQGKGPRGRWGKLK